MMAAPKHIPLAVTTRGAAVECVHYGSIAVVDDRGALLYSAGDSDALTFTRSSLKPLQAIPLLAGAGDELFGFAEPELALLCASHSGEDEHVAAVADMLHKISCCTEDLQCGIHPPIFYSAQEKIPPSDQTWTSLQHNCSGKHCGMLAYCRQHGLPIHNYLDIEHPLQQAIRNTVSRIADLAEKDLILGIDGCSAPNYAFPLSHLALAFARLASGRLDSGDQAAAARLRQAMIRYPFMVSGSKRNDLALMEAGLGDWLTKVGAEGVQAIGIVSRGWGVAIKIADGNTRALYPVTIAVLEQLGLLSQAQKEALASWGRPLICNFRGFETGEIKTVFELGRP